MKSDTWQALDELYATHPIMKAESVPYEEIDSAFAEIAFGLPDDYREFIHRYGGAIVGAFPVFGLRRAGPMGVDDGSFIEVTESFRRQRWPGVENWAVISTDHAGNPIGLDAEGKVWIYDHDACAAQVIAGDFESYLRKRCLNLSD